MKYAALKTTTLTAIALIAGGMAYAASPAPHTDFDSLYRPAPIAASLAAATVYAGEFSGRSDHVTSGNVTIQKTADGYQLVLAEDFFLDGAPDPVVALGNGETFDVANKIGKLKKKRGAQTYDLPATFTPGQFSEVYVWCERFSVPLGVASLT